MSQSGDFAWAVAFACILANFQNSLISRIFSVFWSGFLKRTTVNDLWNGFWHVLWNFNFWAKVRILHGLYPLHAWWPIFKMFSFFEYLVFFGAVFCTEQLEMVCRIDFDMFYRLWIFELKWGFCMGYSLCMHDGRFSNCSCFSNI